MPSFIMKARTRNDVGWTFFSVEDAPVLVQPNIFSLMNRPNSPLLCLDTIRRGDRDTLLFEGEVIESDDTQWMVCYERGFYAISPDYVIKKLGDFSSYKKLGDVNVDVTFPVSLSIKQKLLFKYNDTVFRMESICGVHNKKLLLRSAKKPIKSSAIKQDCGCEYNKIRLYLGDVTEYGVVVLSYGILGFLKDGTFTSVESLRKSDGCI